MGREREEGLGPANTLLTSSSRCAIRMTACCCVSWHRSSPEWRSHKIVASLRTPDDCTEETVRWHPRHFVMAQSLVGFHVQDRDSSSSTCLDHTFRLRIDRPRAAGFHRPGS